MALFMAAASLNRNRQLKLFLLYWTLFIKQIQQDSLWVHSASSKSLHFLESFVFLLLIKLICPDSVEPKSVASSLLLSQ